MTMTVAFPLTASADEWRNDEHPNHAQCIAAKSEEELERLAEEEERKRLRRQKYYGKETGSPTQRMRRRNIYLFKPEDLDNAELVALVEDSPTYQRDKITLNNLKRKSQQDALQATPPDEEANEDGIITFG